MIVFDVNNPASIDVSKWSHLTAKCTFLVANKIDLPRVVTQLEGLEKAEALNMLYEEISAKNNEGVEELFRIACKHVFRERKLSMDPNRRRCECDLL